MIYEAKINRVKTGENIYMLLEKVELTYEQLAEYLNLSTPRVIYDWINGKKAPRVEHVAILSWLFNVNLEEAVKK